jgi:hypothetical protein
MAEDVVILINSFGWTSARSLHVVGISLGGMIAQGEKFQLHLTAARLERLSFITQNWRPAYQTASHR